MQQVTSEQVSDWFNENTKDFSAREVIVLRIIANNYDESLGMTNITSEKVAEQSGYSLRTVRAAITDLRKRDGWKIFYGKGSTAIRAVPFFTSKTSIA
jgi:DNA-binding CsgD family transcriptional regulator